jgi:FAD binding domain
MTEHAAVIVGGNPTGLMLAGALAGVDAAIVERRASQDLPGSRAGGLIAPCADRVQLIQTEYVGTWELPALGMVPAPTTVLIRPDGYVAWSETEPTSDSLTR